MRPSPTRVLLVFALAMIAAPLGVSLRASDASASVSIAVTWEALLRESTSTAIATPVESTAIWENGRIYTYTRVRIDRAIAGLLSTGDDAWVRTRGGIVGDIGQLVDGEPVLSPGRSALLFLHPGPVGAFEVTARGQGQFPVVAGAGDRVAARVVRSHAVGGLVAPRVLASSASLRLAAEVLHDRAVDDVARDIVVDWARAHAR